MSDPTSTGEPGQPETTRFAEPPSAAEPSAAEPSAAEPSAAAVAPAADPIAEPAAVPAVPAEPVAAEPEREPDVEPAASDDEVESAAWAAGEHDEGQEPDFVALAPATSKRAGSSTVVTVVLSVLLAVMIGATAAFGVLWHSVATSKSLLGKRRAAALAEAQSFAQDVTTYNYQTLPQDFAKVLTHAAGTFETQFKTATASSSQFVQLVKQYKATATSQVLGAGIQSATTTSAKVLVLISQTVQNTNRPTAQAERTEGQVTLQWLGGRWKVTDFTVL